MTFLAPGFLYAAIAAALGVAALHFIVAREPRAMAFPTARFVPESSTPALVRAMHFSDPWLLALRVLLLLLVGTALARPVRLPQRERIARVILADRSGASNDPAVRDSVRRLYRPGDAIVAFDSIAHVVSSDSVPATSIGAPASLSAALIAAHAAASRIRAGADSIELVIVSPLEAGGSDRATARIRALWPGRARVVRTAAETRPAEPASVTWNPSVRPPLAIPKGTADTIGAVASGSVVVVAPFARRWTYPTDSLRGATIVARWMDGEPAAIEWPPQGASACSRSIAIPVDSTGDLVLRPAFVALRARLASPCGTMAVDSLAPSGEALATALGGAGGLAPAGAFPPGAEAPSTLAPWLLAAALLVALVELIVRSRTPRGDIG